MGTWIKKQRQGIFIRIKNRGEKRVYEMEDLRDKMLIMMILVRRKDPRLSFYIGSE